MILPVSEPEWPFDRYFELFYSGENTCGDFFDWILSWWNNRHRHHTLILLYESMKADPCENIMKIAAFLGHQYEQRLRSDDELLQSIRNQSSVEHMKDTTDKQMMLARRRRVGDVSGQGREFHIVRKGVVGDWRNYMSSEQSQKMDHKYHQKFDGTGIESLWNDYDIFTSTGH
jgi:hypothetical protein